MRPDYNMQSVIRKCFFGEQKVNAKGERTITELQPEIAACSVSGSLVRVLLLFTAGEFTCCMAAAQNGMGI